MICHSEGAVGDRRISPLFWNCKGKILRYAQDDMCVQFALVLFALLFITPAFAQPPALPPVPPLNFTPPHAERVVLKNGVVVYLLEDHELPIISLTMRMKTSPADAPQGAIDVLDVMGAVWRAGGTVSLSPDLLNERLEFQAASVETSADEDSADISMWCLSKDSAPVMNMFMDVLLHPAFDAKRLETEIARRQEDVRRKNETPNSIARRAFRDVMWGKTHAYSYNSTEASLKKINQKMLRALHKSLVVPDAAVLSVTGDFDKTVLINDLNRRFSVWPKSGRTVPPYDYSAKDPVKGKVFFVHKKFTQSRFTVGRLGLDYHNPDHFALELADYILGGGGPSRLFNEVRSRLGLAYMVGSFLMEKRGTGLVGAVCQTKMETTVEALSAVRDEMGKMAAGPIRDEEVSLAKDAILNSFVFRVNSPANVVSQEAGYEFEGFPAGYLTAYPSKVNAVTNDEIQRVAKRYYAPIGLTVLVVGDREKLGDGLKKFGDVIEIPLEKID